MAPEQGKLDMPVGNVATLLADRLSERPDHRKGCRVAFLYVDKASAPRRRITNIGGWSCLRCAMDETEKIVRRLADVVTTPVLRLGELSHTERRAAVRVAQRTEEDVGFFAVTRDAAPILLLSELNLTPRSRKLRPYLSVKAVSALVDEILAPAEYVQEMLEQDETIRFGRVPFRVTYSAWSDKWRPATKRRESAGGVGSGFADPAHADGVIRAAGYIPDTPSAADPPEVASRIKSAIDDLREEQQPKTDGWGRPLLADPPPASPTSPIDKTHGVS